MTSIADAFSALLALIPNLGIWKITPAERRYRLERMHLLLDRAGNPHLAYRVFHVAGTKGKGSVSVFLASALGHAGYQTGLYTSPHVTDPGERISVTKPPAAESSILTELVARITEIVKHLPTESLPGKFPWTAFELVTVLGFLYFREAKCRFAVIETGIGGRWDATNIVQPFACVLTPVDLEHTDVLGETFESIAREKSGVIKPKIPVFSASQRPEVQQIFRKVSQEQDAPISFLNEEIQHLSTDMSHEGTKVSLKLRGMRVQRFKLKLLGAFQAKNAALAYLVLRKMLPRLHCSTLAEGIGKAFLPGRMELIRTDPPILLDGAHTPLAVRTLRDSVQKLFPEPGILIFGAIAGKNVEEMAKILALYFRYVIVSTPGTFKESHPEEVFAIFKRLNARTLLEQQPKEALHRALELSQQRLSIIVTGSFYMVAEIRKYFL